MATRRIAMSGEEVLRKKSRAVTAFDDKLWVLLDDMYETMKTFNGVGLAAPQVGILRRVVVIETEGEKLELINPVITLAKGKQREVEGCLSSPGEWAYVVRPEKIRLKAQNRYGKDYAKEADGLLAIAICHEIDHLNGVLFTDIADEMVEEGQELENAKKLRNRKKTGV
ncbi:MAG: peptide deformylase [Oscillospiraceae bacterium]|jgi:peptide deformylase|nr:peptide deformylase [Oscillospiraceae bacterium]